MSPTTLHLPLRATDLVAPAADALATALKPLAGPCLLLAALPAAGLMACTASPALVRGINPASADVLLALITLPLWLCLLLGFGGLIAHGRLDRWLGSRALQAAVIGAGVTTLCCLSAGAATLHRPEQAWLAFTLPALALAAGGVLAWPRRANGSAPDPDDRDAKRRCQRGVPVT
jgi:hypothetical protein